LGNRVSLHATQRMFNRNIDEDDVTRLLYKGAIIENYQADFPFPSVLISGESRNNRPLHAVIGIDKASHRLYVITIYVPDPDKWADNFSWRISS
jgi:hypothetical protein